MLTRTTLLFSALLSLVSTGAIAQWTGTTTPAVYHHYSIEAITDNVLLAGGYGGSLVKTTDGGDTWQSLSIGSSDWVKGIHFTDVNNGWLVCHPSLLTDSGYIMKTTNGGATWTEVQHSYNYSSMFWASANVCYIGTWEGVIVKTSNGGTTWTTLNTPTTENIPYLFFLDEQNGFAADNNSKFFRTNDGGATWEEFYHAGIHDFHFFDVNNGYCIDAYGRIGKTTDGGATFTYWITPFPNYKLEDIYFVTPQCGYVVGGLDCGNGVCITKPVILRTTDGGDTWINDTNHPYVGQEIGFYAIAVTPDGTPFLAGSDKIILKNETLAGLDAFETSDITLFPNPASDMLHLEMGDAQIGQTLYVTDLAGHVVRKEHVDAGSMAINVGELSPGMYFVTMKGAASVRFEKY